MSLTYFNVKNKKEGLISKSVGYFNMKIIATIHQEEKKFLVNWGFQLFNYVLKCKITEDKQEMK